MTQLRNRKLIRLKNHDYSQFGFYFLTLCTKNRIPFFGKILNSKLHTTTIGDRAKQCWEEIPRHFPHILIDEFIIMPEHIHGILIINNYYKHTESTQNNIPWQTIWSRSISSAIRGFKIGVIKWCRQSGYPEFAWQKSFHDKIIRSEIEYQNVKQYIKNNPVKLVEKIKRSSKNSSYE